MRIANIISDQCKDISGFQREFFSVLSWIPQNSFGLLKVLLFTLTSMCIKEFGAKILTKTSGSIEQSQQTGRILVRVLAEKQPSYL